jgi:hypothetical protein
MILFEHIKHSYNLYNYNKPYNSYIIKDVRHYKHYYGL